MYVSHLSFCVLIREKKKEKKKTFHSTRLFLMLIARIAVDVWELEQDNGFIFPCTQINPKIFVTG